MPGFEGLSGGTVRLRLDDDEAELLRGLIAEMAGLLEESPEANDPVIERLFPSAYESPEDEAAYRELIGDDLYDHKLRTLETITTVLGQDGGVDETIGPHDVEAWLTFLTDLRLAIGTRLDIDEEKMAAEVDPTDPEAPALSVLHWLGWLQEGILRAVAP